MADALDLITTADVSATLGAATAARADIALWITAVSKSIQSYCNRVFKSASVTETLDSPGRNVIAVSRPPVTAVASFTVDGTAMTTADYDLDADAGHFRRVDGGLWSEGQQIVTAVYTGGYTTIPEPVKLAALLALKHALGQLDATGQYRSERLGDYSYDLADNGGNDLPTAALSYLDAYVLTPIR